MSSRGGGARWALFALLGALTISESPAGAASLVPPAPKTISVSLPGPLSGCDPVGTTVTPSVEQVLSLVLPRATSSAPSGSIAAADSIFVHSEVTNLSPLTVDYQIRKGSTWSDGSRVGLPDFVATARRGARGSGVSAPQYRQIRLIHPGSNHHHIIVVFRTPTSAWPSLFSPLMAASTSQAVLTSCTSPSAAADVSAGPFIIATSSRDQVVLVRNPHWSGRVPPAQWITVQGLRSTTPSISTVTSPLLIERSWMTGQTLVDLTSSATLSSQVDLSNRLLSLNFDTQRGATSSVMVRQAIAHFIDRQELVATGPQTLFPKIAVAGSNLVSQGQPGYTGPPSRPLSDSSTVSSTTTTLPGTKPTGIDLARRFLQKAGWRLKGGKWVNRQGVPLHLRLSTARDDRWAIMATRSIAAQLNRAHLTTTIEWAPSAADVAAQVRRGEADLGVLARPTDPFIAHAAAWFSGPSANPSSQLWTGYRDHSIDTLASQAQRMLNPVTALPLYQQVGRRLWVMMPTLPLFTEPFVTAWSSQLNGVVDNPYEPGTLAAATSWTLNSPAKAP
ncbi:MAG: ABC transporter substrate-binding protein [Actinomycetes bacterium]